MRQILISILFVFFTGLFANNICSQSNVDVTQDSVSINENYYRGDTVGAVYQINSRHIISFVDTFRVLKIKRKYYGAHLKKTNCFVIYLENNGLYYKVVSPMGRAGSGTRIKKNHSYKFRLTSLSRDSYSAIMLNNVAALNGIKLEDSCVLDLFSCDNLCGLHLCE